jgi:uncharacterized protein YciI
MFVLESTRTAPVERVDALMGEHVAWLDEQYAAGVFIASGRKDPRDGGVILAVGDHRKRIGEIAAADPFAAHRVCAYRITEFTATRTAPELASLKQEPPGP